MKSFIILGLMVAFGVNGCVSVPAGGYTSLPNTREFNARFDTVWGAVVSIVSEKATIKNIDKASGLITTEPFTVGSGFFSQNALSQFAYQPPNALGTWGAGQGSVSLLVTRHGETSTTVRVTAKFAGFENNVTHSWMGWPTKGVLESRILDQIGQALAGH